MGQLRRIVNGTLQPQAVTGTPEVDAKGQGGLLSAQSLPLWQIAGHALGYIA
jgi:hypothetical protein